jgi:hypothetical protein
VLASTEQASRGKLGVPVGIWVHELLSTEPATAVAGGEEESSAPKPFMMDPVLARRYGLKVPSAPAEGAEGGAAAPTEGGAAPAPRAAAKKAESTNEIATINLTISAVNLVKVRPQANNEIAFDVEKALKASPLFDDKETSLSGNLQTVEDSAPSFTFPLKLKLKRPIKL